MFFDSRVGLRSKRSVLLLNYEAEKSGVPGLAPGLVRLELTRLLLPQTPIGSATGSRTQVLALTGPHSTVELWRNDA